MLTIERIRLAIRIHLEERQHHQQCLNSEYYMREHIVGLLRLITSVWLDVYMKVRVNCILIQTVQMIH